MVARDEDDGKAIVQVNLHAARLGAGRLGRLERKRKRLRHQPADTKARKRSGREERRKRQLLWRGEECKGGG